MPSHLLELLSSGDSKPTGKAEQAAWQLDGLGHPTFSSYCRAGKGSLKGGPFWALQPHFTRAQVLYYIFYYYNQKTTTQKKTLPYPVFCGFCEDIVWLRAYSIFDIV